MALLSKIAQPTETPMQLLVGWITFILQTLEQRKPFENSKHTALLHTKSHDTLFNWCLFIVKIPPSPKIAYHVHETIVRASHRKCE